jgi:putative transposase
MAPPFFWWGAVANRACDKVFTPRTKLPHNPPLYLRPEEELYFITICSQNRGSRELLDQDRASKILDAAIYRHENGIWFARIFLVMPDHVHALINFHNSDHPMRKAVLDFKRWTARTGSFHWQPDFFDHRLRAEDSMRAKADYILENPVRAGLVEKAEDWPHRFVANNTVG